ncbi:glycosyl transferase family 1 [Erwinia sp. OLTSP20]|uniref:glycosyltransferase family 4 protein n=1 Tax=unclassified Erwinia TaxID=2622719 RepID=UPI000C176EE9|nr:MULTISPECIES: glycosyltransferase family 4 protein [unclassified Erwinia]PIJ49656.1 glycosyl transferase family 1 [Erwinia sp. OAMSP11]PIJ70071.1 glycosyl transferase family 1 [Erwinia sp. OLSSP12]PIJ80568.1 glycosyl transferase family 1 [Erwinia sp. OLCASP19]PIJ82733.1 glycosyl transferase family 1 [Erwinia sp. OLMTSP26]PIJ84810.1 glycosyl transferase family 1 [Erwinia sp. OLMDSP33]
MTKTRLAIVRQKYRPDGGAERFIARALEALDDDTLELNIITRSWQGDPNPEWQLHICNPQKWGRISRESGFARAARACWEREKFDIVQSHERIAGCDIFRAGDGVHRVWLEQRARILSPLQRLLSVFSRYHRYVTRAEAAMFRSPALKKIICNSTMIKQDIMRCFQVPEEKFAVIYNAIDHNKFVPATAQQRQAMRYKLAIADEAKVFIYVGSGFERKGLRAAIQALSHNSAHLIVVGQDKQQKRYQTLARQLGCETRVHFVGVQQQVIPFYHAADGLVLPTLYDPFPNVILEAMACGLPVITSTTCGGAEFIRQGFEGYVTDALDVTAIAQAMQQIPRLSEDRRMADAARQRILPYTPQALARQLHDLYQQVLHPAG